MARKKAAKATTATPDKAEGEFSSPVARWIEEITRAKKRAEPYNDKVGNIVARYKDADKGNSKKRRYNSLWSMTETVKPLIYLDPPTPYVNRRHNVKDAVARDASVVLQRILSYSMQGDDLDDALSESRDDYILASRGVMRIRYSPYFTLRDSDERTYVGDDEPPEGAEIKQDDQGGYYNKQYEVKAYEECETEHVLYKDFLHGPAAKWKDVPWAAFRVPMTRREQIKRFGDKMGAVAPITLGGAKEETKGIDKVDSDEGLFGKSEIWEVWDKASRKIYWLCLGYKDSFLDEIDDVLKLDGFFPMPKPAYACKTNESLEPTPEYSLWQDIALELDDVTGRIRLLTKALRVVGAYDASIGEILKRITTHTDDNEMIPIPNWVSFAEKGGFQGAVAFMPLKEVADTLQGLIARRGTLVQELYEITGISDIVRGASDPRETASAQKIKGNFAGQRLKLKQRTISRQAREALEITAQIICGQYSDELMLEASSAQEYMVDANGVFDILRWTKALALLRSPILRRFRIQINEKSLAAADLQEEREDTTQFIQSISQFLTSALPMAQQIPGSGKMLGELLMMGVRVFPRARDVEARIEEALETIINAPAPPPQTGAVGLSPEEVALKNRELDLRQREIDLQEQQMGIDAQKKQDESQLAWANFRSTERQNANTLQFKSLKHQDDATIKAAQVDVQRASVKDNAILANQTQQHQHALDVGAQSHDQNMRETEFGHTQRVDHREQNREDAIAHHQAAVDREDLRLQAERDRNDAKAAFSKPRAA